MSVVGRREGAGISPVGASVRRLEDQRFLTGKACFIDDIAPPGALHGVVIRSPHAHAVIEAIETDATRRMAGVRGVFTAADLDADDIGALPCTAQVAALAPMIVPPRPALARRRVRHVGDPVVFVVADSLAHARDAAESVCVRYRPLPAVTDARDALAHGAPLLWEEAPGNLSFRFQKGDRAAVDAAFASAAHVVERDLVNNRLIVAPLETRGAIGSHDAATESFHLIVSGAGVHGMRDVLADRIFHLPRSRVRVSAPDVGGGFGIKNAVYPEHVLLLWAARRLGLPVKWIADRAEDFTSAAQGRDNRTRARLALDADGRFLALDVQTVANLGAYVAGFGPGTSTSAPSTAMGGVYDIPAVFMDVRGALTNTVPIDAYRGAGKPEANYLIERLVDAAARRLSLDPFELRRRNMMARFPHRSALGITIDGGRFAANLDAAEAAADRPGFARRREESARRGMLRGLGVACFLETARGQPNEAAEIRFEPEGAVTLIVGTQSNGQGHETSYRQIAADLLGLPLSTFRYVQADTHAVATGGGHGGARSMHMGGAALARAAEAVIEQGRSIAARLLQAAHDSVVFDAGRFSTTDGRNIALLDVARAAADFEFEPRFARRCRRRGVHLSQRLPRRRGRGRSGDRGGHAGAVSRGRRFRPSYQSNAHHRTGAGWRRARHRPGADGALGLRSGERPARQRHLHGLRDSARGRSAGYRCLAARHADRREPARGEGVGPSRRDRRAADRNARGP